MILQGPAYFQRTLRRGFRVVEKYQRHSVARRKTNQLAGRFRFTKMRRLTDNFVQLVQDLALIIDQKLRVTHHIHEKDMTDFELKIGF